MFIKNILCTGSMLTVGIKCYRYMKITSLTFQSTGNFWKGKQATTKCIKGDPRVPQKVISSLHHQVNFLGRNHVKD
jgi:hypothetical protein